MFIETCAALLHYIRLGYVNTARLQKSVWIEWFIHCCETSSTERNRRKEILFFQQAIVIPFYFPNFCLVIRWYLHILGVLFLWGSRNPNAGIFILPGASLSHEITRRVILSPRHMWSLSSAFRVSSISVNSSAGYRKSIALFVLYISHLMRCLKWICWEIGRIWEFESVK